MFFLGGFQAKKKNQCPNFRPMFSSQNNFFDDPAHSMLFWVLQAG